MGVKNKQRIKVQYDSKIEVELEVKKEEVKKEFTLFQQYKKIKTYKDFLFNDEMMK